MNFFLARAHIKAQDPTCVNYQRHDTCSDHDRNEQRCYRIKYRPSIKLDEEGRDNDSDRTKRVRHDMQENATHIVTMSFVVVSMVMVITMSIIWRAVSRSLHPMVIVMMMVMLQSARIAG